MIPKLGRRDENNEEIIHQVQRLLEEKGRKMLELTKKLMLEKEENIKCDEVRKALRYFLNEYWSDLVRPALVSIACEAVGGNCRKVTSIAVPIMLVTAGIDIHDDVIDQSVAKDRRLTVFGKFGKDIALLAGDAFMFKGFTRLHLALRKFHQEKAASVLEIIEDTFFELGDAEALELGFRVNTNVSPEEYLQMVRKKAADVEAYTHISTLLADGTKEEIEALCKYGRDLGMMAIIRDDLIDMMDEEELMHRLENEALPLPMLYATQNPKAKSLINSILHKGQKTNEDIQRILEITAQNDGFARAEKKIHELMENAFLSLKPIERETKELKALINFMKTT